MADRPGRFRSSSFPGAIPVIYARGVPALSPFAGSVLYFFSVLLRRRPLNGFPCSFGLVCTYLCLLFCHFCRNLTYNTRSFISRVAEQPRRPPARPRAETFIYVLFFRHSRAASENRSVKNNISLARGDKLISRAPREIFTA